MTTRKSSRDLENANETQQETKSTDHHVPKSSKKQPSDMVVPGPIYFLLREQAKSLVAIKELKERVRSLEGVQDDVFQAVNGLQVQMDRSLQLVSCYPDMVKASLYPSTKSNDFPITKASPATQSRSRNVPAATTTDEGKKEHSESDSKQDSGLDSDCQVHHVSLSAKKGLDGGDELLDLLEVIAQKGSGLWKRVEECERLRTLEEEEAKETLSNQDVAGLLQVCRNLQKKLRDANHEKGSLRSQLLFVDRVLQDMKAENGLLEERLEAVLRDKQKLESQIHRLHSQFVSNKDGHGKQDPSWQQSTEQKPKKIGRLRNSEESRNRVAAILKESNVLELQRQLLMYIMENQVLTTKMEQLEQLRHVTATEAEKTELRMQSDVQQLLKERNELQAAVEESRMELTAVQAKTRMLERALHAVSEGPDEYGSLEVSGTSVRSQPSLNWGNRRHAGHHPLLSSSLPPNLMPGTEHFLEEIQPFQDTSGYLNITGGDNGSGGRDTFPISNNTMWASTPIKSRFESPGFGSSSKFLTPRESPASGTKGIKMSQSDTFLREFDPLMQTDRDSRRGRVSEYIDSLDAPTKIFGPMDSERVSSNAPRPLPMSLMGNFVRTPLIRSSQKNLRFSDPRKRRSDSFLQTIVHQEALL